MTKKQLQDRVIDLEVKLSEVCVNPESVKAKMIIHEEKFKVNMAAVFWRGISVKTDQSFDGLLKQINK